MHLIEHCNRSVDVSESDASVDQAIVQNFIWIRLWVGLDLLEQVECSVQIFSISTIVARTFDTFNQGGESEVVRSDTIVLHLDEEVPRLVHLATPHTSINDGVVRHIISFELT